MFKKKVKSQITGGFFLLHNFTFYLIYPEQQEEEEEEELLAAVIGSHTFFNFFPPPYLSLSLSLSRISFVNFRIFLGFSLEKNFINDIHLFSGCIADFGLG